VNVQTHRWTYLILTVSLGFTSCGAQPGVAVRVTPAIITVRHFVHLRDDLMFLPATMKSSGVFQWDVTQRWLGAGQGSRYLVVDAQGLVGVWEVNQEGMRTSIPALYVLSIRYMDGPRRIPDLETAVLFGPLRGAWTNYRLARVRVRRKEQSHLLSVDVDGDGSWEATYRRFPCPSPPSPCPPKGSTTVTVSPATVSPKSKTSFEDDIVEGCLERPDGEVSGGRRGPAPIRWCSEWVRK